MNQIISWIEDILISLGFFSWVVLNEAYTKDGNKVEFRGQVQMTKQQALYAAQEAGAKRIAGDPYGPFRRIVTVSRRIECLS